MQWNDVNRQFGNILRKIREARGLSQEEFAERCNISRAYYGRLERGEHSITLDLCRKISDATELSMSQLFSDIV